MTRHLRRSRVTKALTDAGLAASFADAEALLDAVNLVIAVGPDQAVTPTGQAATLTAIATAFKCFGRVSLATRNGGAPLLLDFPLGVTLADAATALGADVVDAVPASATHVVVVGAYGPILCGWALYCWWDRWLAGVRMQPQGYGDSRLGLAGVFAGALAVRRVFATVISGSSGWPEDATVSLWEPWNPAPEHAGPARFTAPNAVWIVGLGHLGQAFVWNLLTIPYREGRRAVLQDDQGISIENEPTSLLVTTLREGQRKVRLARDWLEPAGWATELIERRHRGDIALTAEDPPFLLSGLDDVRPRRILATVGFDFMIDAGIGHGPTDFDGLQIRVVPKGAAIDRLWIAPADPAPRDQLLKKAAYQALETEAGACGAFTLANASVAVPFVGAATGALAIAQLVRLASGLSGAALLQMGLASPEMVLDGGQSSPPVTFLGGEVIDLTAGRLAA